MTNDFTIFIDDKPFKIKRKKKKCKFNKSILNYKYLAILSTILLFTISFYNSNIYSLVKLDKVKKIESITYDCYDKVCYIQLTHKKKIIYPFTEKTDYKFKSCSYSSYVDYEYMKLNCVITEIDTIMP